MRIAEATAPDVAARLADGTPVLLPMGSLETHGPALPMGDFLLAEAVAARIAGTAEGLLLPPLPYGGEDFFADIPGAVALPSPVLEAVLRAIAAALVRNGARRLLIVNGHGGSVPAIEAVQRWLRREHGVIAPALHLWPRAAELWQSLGGDPAALGHGAEPIRSVAAALLPALTRPAPTRPAMTQAVAPPAMLLGLPVRNFGAVTCDGVSFAVPTEAAEVAPGGEQAPGAPDPERGAAIVARLVQAGVAMIERLRAATEGDAA